MKTLLVAAAGTMVACNSDSAAIMKRLDQIETLVKQKCGGGGGQPAREREEPAPDATFAVDVRPNVALGMVEGPPNACVTLVEAWDFA